MKNDGDFYKVIKSLDAKISKYIVPENQLEKCRKRFEQAKIKESKLSELEDKISNPSRSNITKADLFSNPPHN